MKSIKFSLVVIGTLLAVFILVGCASSPTEKDALTTAGAATSIPDYSCHLIIKQNIFFVRLDGSSVNKNAEYNRTGFWSLAPGSHSLGLQYREPGVSSLVINLTYFFEADKVYYLNYLIVKEAEYKNSGLVRIFIGEEADLNNPTEISARLTTDNPTLERSITYLEQRQESQRQYIAYVEANPGLLEGTWIDKKGKTHIFAGDTIVFNDKALWYKIRIEGTFTYNENTIISFGKQGKLGGAKMQIAVIGSENILHYQLSGNTLIILDGKWGPAYKADGTYVKQGS